MSTIQAGQIRRFKNANHDARYVVLKYGHGENCLVMMIDHITGWEVGQITAFAWDVMLFKVSTECEP